MPRLLSPIITAQKDLPAPDVWLAADILLPDGVTVIRAAEIALTVSSVNVFGTSTAVTPTPYAATLRQSPQVSFSRNAAPQGGELAIENLSRTLGMLVGQVSRTFDGSLVTLTTCWRKVDGTYEADIIFRGEVREVKADENLVSFTLISDLSRRTAIVASRQLSQRCIAEFEDDKCRHTGAAPGSTCSKVYDDAKNGCLFWEWQHAFWGIDFLVFDTVGQIGNHGGSGWDPTSTTCPARDMVVAVLDVERASYMYKRADELEQGDTVAAANGLTGRVTRAEVAQSDRMYRITCFNGAALDCTPEHPVIRDFDDDYGDAAETLSAGDEVLTLIKETGESKLSIIKRVGEIVPRQCVKITTTAPHIFAAGHKDAAALIFGHNKPGLQPYQN